jgi:uncharacterized protein
MPTALITGASAGLGTDFARILASMKYDLILVARNESRLSALAGELSTAHGIKCDVIALDLSQSGSAGTLYGRVSSAKHTIDVLVNNAGCGVWGPFAKSDPEALSRMLTLNINTLAELTRLILPDMLRRDSGRILNVASTAAFQPGPWMAAYYASKAFVLSLGEALSVEAQGTQVTISTLCPGPTRTEFFDRAGMASSRLKNLIFADSFHCAQNGINGMLKGKTVIVDGWLNFIVTQFARIMPRFLMRQVAGLINDSAK